MATVFVCIDCSFNLVCLCCLW